VSSKLTNCNGSAIRQRIDWSSTPTWLSIPVAAATDVIANRYSLTSPASERGPELTVLHLLNVRDQADYDHRAHQRVHAVWRAWNKQHAVIAAAVRELASL
jgi:hypothetical protein